MAQRYRREVPRDQRGNSKEQRELFRKKWAKDIYTEVLEQRRQCEEIVDEDISGGTYEPFDVIHSKEGGDASAANFDAAKNYAWKCLALGGRWIRYNDFTKRLELLYLKLGVKQTFKKNGASSASTRRKRP